MPLDKRDIPLVVLEALENYSKRSSDLFQIVNNDDALLRFEDMSDNPKHFFQFKDFKNTNNNQLLTISFKPRNSTDPTAYSTSVEVSKIEPHFKNWISLLERYKKSKFLDDPILRQYEAEFYQEFEIIDSDADTNSYPFQTQLWLDKYIDNTLKKLDINYPKNLPEINSIKADLEDLRETQTELTKKKVLEKLSRIFAKARKFGLKLLKEIYLEAQKELIKQLISGKIDLP
ncbi:MAG TPA: hypothetical protein PKL31_13295 [Fulvivirga sp.]|nr:hypothetical protein [Fulvivirga sp.]